MANDLHTESEASLTHLVSGIINDAQELIKQQLDLLRHEVKADLRKAKEATLALLCGAVAALVGGIVLCMMLVHLLKWTAPDLEMWACYGIVGAPIAVVGGALIFAANQKFKALNPMPDQSVEALKENMQWISNPK